MHFDHGFILVAGMARECAGYDYGLSGKQIGAFVGDVIGHVHLNSGRTQAFYVADIYTLTRDQLLTLDGFGPRSADRLLEGVEASKSVPFDRVVYALSISAANLRNFTRIAKCFSRIFKELHEVVL